jgi:hypothetical protein
MKNIVSILMIGMLLTGGLGAVVATTTTQTANTTQETITFSEPVLTTHDGFTTVQITDTSSSTNDPGAPVLPYYTKVFTFPLGTTITSVNWAASSTESIHVPQDVTPAPEPTLVSKASSTNGCIVGIKNEEIYSSTNPYPTSRISYRVGGGLEGNTHVTILSVTYYPLQYSPLQHLVSFTPTIQMTVSYQPPKNPKTMHADMNLLVIAPSEFSSALQPLIDHKNQHGFATTLQTTEDIIATYQGRDTAEKIKYAIKDAVETQGASYVLLVGGVDTLPIRESQASDHGYFGEQLITDLYYADVFDAQGNFCSWDANNNNIFGESGDKVDLYPDVHLGRLACDSVEEVNVVVDKIIHYETETYGSAWYNNLILIGGNTFFWPGNEGEELNTMVMHIMSQFTPEIIWTSKHNFNRMTISSTITKGAGFLDYSGHGVEYGMITYTPSYLAKKGYFTPYIKDLKNGYKLPVVFFDACSTTKLDFVLQDILNYKTWRVFDVLAQALKMNTSKRLTCYAWAFMAHPGGGAIATIGATRVAFGGFDDGAGKISLEFFSAYNSSQYLGEMTSKMQTGYINDVHGDSFTVEEFILLGDPTLRLGGYPIPPSFS